MSAPIQALEAKSRGELLEQRLRKWLKTMKRGPAPRELINDISEAADLIEWLRKERDTLITLAQQIKKGE